MSVLLYNDKYELSEKITNYNDFVDFSTNTKNNGIAIVPTSKLIKRLKIRYIQQAGKPVPEINIFNIEKFVNMLFEEFFDKKKYEHISDAYKRLLFEEAAATTEFELYSRNGKIGSPILEKLEKVITGMKEKGIMPEEMEEAEGDLFDNLRFRDINSLYQNYQNILSEENLLDYPEKIIKLTKYLINPNNTGRVNTFLNKFDFILLSGFSQFKIPEARLFGLIANLDIPFAINVDLDRENAPVFGNLQEVIKEIREFAGMDLKQKQLFDDKVTDIKPENYDNSPASIALRKWLFHTEVNIDNKNLKECLKIFQADDVEDEVKSITKLVKYLIVKENYKPYEICITSRQPEKYSSLFRMSFASSGIPANISDRFPLDSSIVSTAIIDALNILKKGFKTVDVFKFIQNPLVDFSDEININNLMKVTGELRFFGGHSKGGIKRWQILVENTLAYLKNYAKEANNDEIDEYTITKRIDEYKKALKDIKIIKEKFNFKISDEFKIQEFETLILDKIIDRFNIKSQILDLLDQLKQSANTDEHLYYTKIEELEKNSRALTQFLNVLSEFVYIHSVRYPDAMYDLDYLTEKLTTAIQADKYNIFEKMDYGVEITSIEQTRGISFKVMILCGTVDGSFPIPYQTDTYLGKELEDSEEKHKREEQIQFYQFLTNNTELLDKSEQKIFVFYPSSDNQKELIRSHFIDAVLRISSSDSDMESNVNILDELRKDESKKYIWLDAVTTLDEMYYNYNKVEDENYKEKIKSLESVRQEFKKMQEYLNGELQLDIENMNETQQKLLKKAFDKSFSISELETYAGCPYQYFAKRIINFKEKEEFEQGLSFMESGSILHNILYRFFKELYDEGKNVEIENFDKLKGIRLIDEHKEFYRTKIQEIAKEEFESKNIDTVSFNADRYNITKVGGVLDNWLNFELELYDNEDTYYAAFFEKGFAEGNKPITLEDDLKIRGKIDRIDIKSDNNKLIYRVIDYKRTENSMKTNNDIKKGKSFQMPVYIKAANKILSEYTENSDYDAAVYYPIYQKKGTEIGKVLSKGVKKNDPDNLIENAFEMINNIRHDISEAKFNIKPVDKKYCENCSFSSVCRITEKRII